MYGSNAEQKQIVKTDGKTIAEARNEKTAEEIAERLNAEEDRREEDRWSGITATDRPEVHGGPGMTDQDLVLSALEEAQSILAEYVDPGRLRSADFTISRLLLILDRRELVEARNRLRSGYGLRVVK